MSNIFNANQSTEDNWLFRKYPPVSRTPQASDKNLNHAEIRESGQIEDFSTVEGNISVYFRDLEKHLVSTINQYPVVVGCVAWLTNKTILDSMLSCDAVSIIVQKEDFLRPDTKSFEDLHRAYARLRGQERYWFGGLAGSISVSAGNDDRAVRCAGNHNSDKKPAHPRMHHKFLVFCDRVGSPEGKVVAPKKVWTGSFNFSHNSTNSLENAVLINSETIATAYYKEWEQIFAISEPLDWESKWVAPEWRLGT